MVIRVRHVVRSGNSLAAYPHASLPLPLLALIKVGMRLKT
jgi:hypothetical protein